MNYKYKVGQIVGHKSMPACKWTIHIAASEKSEGYATCKRVDVRGEETKIYEERFHEEELVQIG